ncbi:MAG TPA: peptidoglycan bridge formation protein FemAB [Treponema sp.]|nr:peptidoglycan bridge formation protein FemAB [Treponema sp.]
MEKLGFIRGVTQAGISACSGAVSFLQSEQWGAFKARFGWNPRAFFVDWEGGGQIPLLALVRRIAPGFSFAYVPWGPELPAGVSPENGRAALPEVARKLKPFLPRNTVFVRFDPPWFVENGAAGGADDCRDSLKRAAADIQPPDTVLVDLSVPCEEILAAMKPKWRYNISLAEKRGVIVERPDIQGVDLFYRLLEETARRDGIAVHSVEYYRTLFEIFGPELRLYTAAHEGDALAAIVVLFHGKQATYLYGASSNIKRNLMSPYALQWRAMRDAKDSGCAVYDLFGIPPDENPDHPMAGLYRFKTGFGGKIIHRPGSLDFPFNPLVYGLFRAAESLRKKSRDAKKRR